MLSRRLFEKGCLCVGWSCWSFPGGSGFQDNPGASDAWVIACACLGAGRIALELDLPLFLERILLMVLVEDPWTWCEVMTLHEQMTWLWIVAE